MIDVVVKATDIRIEYPAYFLPFDSTQPAHLALGVGFSLVDIL